MDLFGEEPASEKDEPEPVSLEIVKEDIFVDPDLQHPRHMPLCYGHEGVEKALLTAYEEGRMPHGIIFAGQKGIGKATMAYRLARFLLKNGIHDPNQGSMFDDGADAYTSLEVDPEDPNFRRVASGGHADFMSVERAFDATKNRYKDSVAVDSIRKVPGFLRMTASDGGWRVVIIDDADTMNRNAQNALLKILEEPPKNAILILVTHRMGALIPTIRSRTQVYNFQPLLDMQVQELLTKFGVEQGAIPALSALGEGSVGKALDYNNGGGLETLEELFDVLNGYPDWDWLKIHAIADSLASPAQSEAYDAFQNLLCWVFAQLVVMKARGHSSAPDILDKPALQELLLRSSLESLLKICENLHEHFLKVRQANLDKRQAILTAFSKISA
ncbi:MAG: DNA polymerase III subunit delta' [Pseudomonadota bacterium]